MLDLNMHAKILFSISFILTFITFVFYPQMLI